MICTRCLSPHHRASRCPLGRGKAALAIVLLMPLLAGCAKTPPVQTVTDTFCLTAEKRKWSVDDRPDLIQEARVWNATVDKRCGTKKTS